MSRPFPGPQGAPSADNNIFGLIDAKPWYWLALSVVLLVVFLVRRLENSRVGRAWLAVREDEDAAAVMGVYPFKFKLWAFAIGAALGGLSGLLFASRQGFIEPNQFNANLSILFVAMVVVGGSGNMAGVGARRGPAGVPAGAVPRFRGVPVPGLRPGAGAGHAAASAGPAAEPAAGARVEGPPGGGAGRCLTCRTEVLLDVDHVTLRFGGVVALNDVSFSLYKGEILGLIGPNGAGKTTCFNVMTGVYKPTSGAVRFDQQKITGRKPHEINRMGVARTFQNIRLFPEMTALENVMVGTDSRHYTSVLGALFRLYRKRVKPEELPRVDSSNSIIRATQQVRRTSAKIFGLSRHTLEERAGERKSLELLKFVGIEGRANDLARNLPYGDQRRLEIARALATEPKLLCLDEPAAGFNPAEKEQLQPADPQDPRPGVHRAAHRARHAAGHGRDRPDRGARVRQEDRRGHPGRGTGQPEGHRRLPGGDRLMLLELENITLQIRSHRGPARHHPARSTRARSWP